MRGSERGVGLPSGMLESGSEKTTSGALVHLSPSNLGASIESKNTLQGLPHTSTLGHGFDPGWGTKVSHVVWYGKKKKKKRIKF